MWITGFTLEQAAAYRQTRQQQVTQRRLIRRARSIR